MKRWCWAHSWKLLYGWFISRDWNGVAAFVFTIYILLIHTFGVLLHCSWNIQWQLYLHQSISVFPREPLGSSEMRWKKDWRSIYRLRRWAKFNCFIQMWKVRFEDFCYDFVFLFFNSVFNEILFHVQVCDKINSTKWHRPMLMSGLLNAGLQ